MSESTINLSSPLAGERSSPHRTHNSGAHHTGPSLIAVFLLIAGTQFAFGMWMDSQGFVYGDAYSRAIGALLALYGSDPHLAVLGFVWMPLPSLLDLPWVALYPLWPGVVSSGFASTLTTALAGGATAVLLLETSRRLGISTKLGWAYTLLVAANPMLFLYAGSGLSEGVAAPFLIGAVCLVTLLWHSGERRYITFAGLTLGLGVASLYEAIPYGAALSAALVLWALWHSPRTTASTFRRRWQFAEGLGILLIAPSIYVILLWVGANALIMKNPLYFATSQYANYAKNWATGGAGRAFSQAFLVAGDLFGTVEYVAVRTAPFLIPGIALMVVRVLGKRFWRIDTLALVLLLFIVPLGLIAPLVYLGDSFGWLRFFMYPLFVAAGWGLYETALSRHHPAAIASILGGWIVAAPLIVSTMANPKLGQEEHWEVASLLTGSIAGQTVRVDQQGKTAGFPNVVEESAPVARYLESDIFPMRQLVALDAVQGLPIAAQIRLEDLQHLLILNPDRRFKRMIANPVRYHVSYFLVPNPTKVPEDAINRAYPGLWAGTDPRFVLVKSFPSTVLQWRLCKAEIPVQRSSTKQANNSQPVEVNSAPAPGNAAWSHLR